MPEMNTIYDTNNNVIGIFRFGVAWSKKPWTRLGEYDESQIYDNLRNLVATYDGLIVRNADGNTLGSASNGVIEKDGEEVGKYIGTDITGATALALLFSDLELPAYENDISE